MNTANDPTPEQAASSRNVASGGESESFDDVRQFIDSLSSRTCEEAIGLSAQGGLVSGIVQATLGFAVVLLAFTAIPFWLGSNETATASDPTAETTANTDNPVAPPVTTTAGETAGDNEIDLSKAADVMGIDETKTASPAENPLDKNLDNLLDGVD